MRRLISVLIVSFGCALYASPTLASCSNCGGGCTGAHAPGCAGSACYCRGPVGQQVCRNVSISGPDDDCNPEGGQPPRPEGRINTLGYESTSAPMTLDVSGGSHADVFLAIEEAYNWTITIDSGVSAFTVTGTWSNTSWYGILGDIVDDEGLCASVNTSTHVITITNCT